MSGETRIFPSSLVDDWSAEFKQNVGCRLNRWFTVDHIDQMYSTAIAKDFAIKAKSFDLEFDAISENELPDTIVDVLSPFAHVMSATPTAHYTDKVLTSPYVFSKIKPGGTVAPHRDPDRETVIYCTLAHPGTRTAPLELYYENEIMFIDNRYLSFYAWSAQNLHGVFNNDYNDTRISLGCTLTISYTEFIDRFRSYII